jgi:two-component system chemotaxis response regulator CheB
VDDSLTVRAVLRRLFAGAGDMEVAAEAADGAEGVEAVLRVRPDVVLMDVEMPKLDGFAATERIMALRPTPILVLTSRANRDHVHTAFEAMRRGAVELLAKPEDPAGWATLAESLPRLVRSVVRSPRPPAARRAPELTPDEAADARPRALRYVAVGASTGGPGALRELLAQFPADAPVGVLVVQHIASGFEEGLAEWLATQLPLDVRIAQHGENAFPGAVRIAPPGAHLVLCADGTLHLDAATPPRAGHRPSADVLFNSCAQARPRETAGVLLTGMGSDGADGLLALRQAGGLTLVQDEASSAVFGMPRAALERGAAGVALPPAKIGLTLVRCWQGGV